MACSTGEYLLDWSITERKRENEYFQTFPFDAIVFSSSTASHIEYNRSISISHIGAFIIRFTMKDFSEVILRLKRLPVPTVSSKQALVIFTIKNVLPIVRVKHKYPHWQPQNKGMTYLLDLYTSI